VKITLRDHESKYAPGTKCRHFGVEFVVQENKTLLADVPESIANMLITPGRAVEIKEQSIMDQQFNSQSVGPSPVEEVEETESLDMPNFGSMTKDECFAWAQDTHGIELDRKKSKSDTVQACKDIFAANQAE